MTASMHDTRERLIRLEVQVSHITTEAEETHAKVNEMHNLLMQAKGARWFIVGLASVGAFLASFAAKYLPFTR